MASISVGESKSGRRALTHDLPLVPFIDFMICLISFLIMTAVWTQLSRLSANGALPHAEGEPAQTPRRELHVVASEQGFDLRWQEGATVVESRQVPRVGVQVQGEVRYPGLSQALTAEWQAHGVHRAVTDPALDRAVLHVPNDAAFAEIVAVLDSLHAPRRGKSSAFDVSLSSD